MNTNDSPSHIPTVFSFGPGVAKCEQHAYPTAAAFLSCTLEILDLIAADNVCLSHTHRHTNNNNNNNNNTDVGNLDVLESRLLFYCFQPEG